MGVSFTACKPTAEQHLKARPHCLCRESSRNAAGFSRDRAGLDCDRLPPATPQSPQAPRSPPPRPSIDQTERLRHEEHLPHGPNKPRRWHHQTRCHLPKKHTIGRGYWSNLAAFTRWPPDQLRYGFQGKLTEDRFSSPDRTPNQRHVGRGHRRAYRRRPPISP